MEYRRLGRFGLRLSAISLGAWNTFGDQIEEKTAIALTHAAYEMGINFFDNADIYAHGQAEKVMGKAIRSLPRPGLVISSKVFNPTLPGVNGKGLSRKHIFEACHASLSRLGTDYLDLYFSHRYDPETPLDETIRAMGDLIHQGKILYWGTSNWTAAQIADAHQQAARGGWHAPVVEQPIYNLFIRRLVEHELAPLAQALGIGLVSYSPLRNGLLSGKYNQDKTPQGARLVIDKFGWANEILAEENLARTRQITDLASEFGLSTAQFAIAFLLRTQEISSVITGATKVAHIEDNIKALEAVEQISDQVVAHVDEIIGPGPEPEF
jgi:voltage-dependent potassium channel beta subunit